MAGSSDPNQGGQANRSGRSNQGRQAPTQGTRTNQGRGANQPAHGQQRRQPPGGGGGNGLDALGSGEPNQYLKGIISTMATVGLLLGVLVFLLGIVGGFAVLPGAYDDAKSDIGQQGGVDGVPATSQVNADYVDKVESSTFQTINGYLVSLIAPFLAFLMAPIFGAVVAFRMGPNSSKELTVAAGTFVGGILFMLLATFIASLSIPDIAAFAPEGTGALVSAAAEEEGVSTGLGSVRFLKLLINSVVVGAVTAAAAVATTYSIDNFVSS